MRTATILKAGSAVIALGAAVAVAAFALNNLPLGLSALTIVLAAGFASILVYLRHGARIAATANRARKRAEADLSRSLADLIDKTEKSATAQELRWIRHRLIKLEKTLQQAPQREPAASGSASPSAPATASPADSPAKYLVGIGFPPEHALGGWPISPLLPGELPKVMVTGSVIGVVIDEIAFTHGLWKSLGASHDGYLLSELTSLLKAAERHGMSVVIVRRPETPEHLRFIRRGGSVVDDPTAIPPSIFPRLS
ncbi:MAG: hypothetical protein Q4B08_08410 [Propionibacteriaceae bacterium]|nr:hypothetical protein [Propionibacteriaceae bacterium]